jgi:phosphoglycerol transferase MdoB-like AlkP superfamily enzyme
MTLSSHEPFEIPIPDIFEGDDEQTKFMNAMYYADQSLGNFIDSAKQQSWWNNTLVIIVADHGHRIPETGKKVDEFKIPMLWLGGALAKPGLEVPQITSQIDISSTLLNQLGINAYGYNWSKNIFDPKTKPWAFFSFNNGFGFIQPKSQIVFDNVGKKMIQLNGNMNTHDIDLGKSLMQRMFQDYLDK